MTLSYARGWRLPGGGRKKSEDAEAAVLRELQEEIGLVSHGEVRKVTDFTHRPDHKRDRSSLFLIFDVIYHPCWSLEIKAVREFDLDALPAGTAEITRRLIAAAATAIGASPNVKFP